jgi:hypothetical protein
MQSLQIPSIIGSTRTIFDQINRFFLAILSYVITGLVRSASSNLPLRYLTFNRLKRYALDSIQGDRSITPILKIFNEALMVTPAAKLQPVYELGGRFAVGEKCYVCTVFLFLACLSHMRLVCIIYQSSHAGGPRPSHRSDCKDNTHSSRDFVECS